MTLVSVLAVWVVSSASGQLDGGVTVITGSRTRTAGTTALRASEARTRPALEHDTAKAVLDFPGVGRPAQGQAELALWGTAPGQSRVEFDGVELPSLFHLGGYRSVLSPSLINRVELQAAPSRPESGRGLGGLIRLESARPADGLHGEASADVSDVSAALTFSNARVHTLAAARMSLLNAVVQPWLRGVAIDRFTLPRAWDAQARVALQVTERDEVSALVLAWSDALDASVASGDLSLTRARRQTSNVGRLALAWRRGDASEGGHVTAWVGLEQRRLSLLTPLAEAHDDEESWPVGWRARTRTSVTDWLSLELGVDGLWSRSFRTRMGSTTLPPREGDASAFGQPLPDDQARDRWRVSSLDAAAFVGAIVTQGPWSLSPQLRLSALSSDVSRRTPVVAQTPALGQSTLDFLLEPRVNAQWSLPANVDLLVAAGLAHQGASAAELSAVFGTPTLGPSRGWQVIAGVEARPIDVVSAELNGFVRGQWALPVRDPTVTARLANVLISSGEGRSAGGTLAAHFRWKTWWANASWTFSRSERRTDASSTWRLADWDQPHVLSANAGWSSGDWRAGVRFRWSSGLPSTAVVTGDFDARRGVFEPRFGALNGTRLPDFLQLDVELSRRFDWGRVWLEPYLEVLNVTNHQNVETWSFDSAFTRREPLLGMPVFGTLGVRGGL